MDKVNLIRVYLKNGHSIESIANLTKIPLDEVIEIIEKYIQ